MRKTVIGVFVHREDAEKAINYIHNKLDIPNGDISYVYRNTKGEIREVDAASISSDTPSEGAEKGAGVGLTVGALAGIAASIAAIPIVGPLFIAGPLFAAIGVTGVAGAAAAGAASGAVVGGIVGALSNIGVGIERAKRYEDQVYAGNVLLSVTADSGLDVEAAMAKWNAMDIETHTLGL